jgi:hypothetical protein
LCLFLSESLSAVPASQDPLPSWRGGATKDSITASAPAAGHIALADGRSIPIFDAHIHYSEDVWEPLPPDRAIAWLTRAGIDKARVSGTPSEGAERLYRAAPDRIVPFLRPYPARAHRKTWFGNPDVPGSVLERLGRIPYRGIGEFHVFGEDADSDVARQVIRIARDRGFALHAHTDTEGMRRILAQAPDTAVSSGPMPDSTSPSTRMPRDHPHPLIEVGMDTYVPSRWANLDVLAQASRT